MANTLKFGNGEWYGKKDTILAYNDENDNYKPLPFDFSRNSSATVINKDGLIETVGSGEPRIDYKDNTKGALLLEPQRTNRLTNSEDGSSWTLSNLTLSSLSGGLNKEYYQITSLGNTGRFDVVGNSWVNLTAGTYTASVFAKKGTSDEIILTTRANYTAQSAFSVFNLTSGTVVLSSGVTGSIEPYSDGWYRCAINFTNSGGYTDFGSFAFGFNFNSSSTDTLFVASPQSEIGSYATSYIPTSGSAVTRVADSSSQTPPDGVIGQTEGTVYWEINVETTVATANENILNIDNGSFGNTIYLIKSATGNLIGEMYVSGGAQASFTKTNITKGVHKMAMGYANNNTAFFVDGVQVSTTDTSCTVPLMSRIQLGNGALGTSDCLSNDVKLYNTRLSNSELAALTTI
jgi:uncharacterized membrane protein